MPKKQTAVEAATNTIHCVCDEALIVSRRADAGYQSAVTSMTKLPKPVLARVNGFGLLQIEGYLNNGLGLSLMAKAADGGKPIPIAAQLLGDRNLWQQWTGTPLPEPQTRSRT